MTMPDSRPPDGPPQGMSTEKYARLRAEAKAPYRGLRRVVYLTAGASAAIGAFIMITQGLAGRATADLGVNLLIQFGVLGTAGLLWWLESRGQS
jgi:high-affinity Fe2+/Pb2+ permease